MPFLSNPNLAGLDRAPTTQAMVTQHPTPDLSLNQCGSFVARTIDAPLTLVWSLVRRFYNPLAYKLFVKRCVMVTGTSGIGSRERLEALNDDTHVMKFSIINGDHKLRNYRSTVSLHQAEEEDSGRKTTAIESCVVDVLVGNSKEDTMYFAETIIGCNQRTLTNVAEGRSWLSYKQYSMADPDPNY